MLVDGRQGHYLRTVCDYVHLNPARAWLIGADEPLERYDWSSDSAYLRPARGRPAWLRVDRLMGEHGVKGDSATGRREFALATESVRGEQMADGELKSIRRGWKFGADDFVEWLTEKAGMSAGEGHPRQEREETEAGKAERMCARRWRDGNGRRRNWKSGARAIPRKCSLPPVCERRAQSRSNGSHSD